MPSIGSASSLGVWKGTLVGSSYGFSLYEQGGVDGFGVLFGGRKIGPQVVTTITRVGTTLTDYNAAQSAYRGLAKTSVSVIDQFNLSWSGVIVLDVKVAPSVDPIGYIATTAWTLLVQSI